MYEYVTNLHGCSGSTQWQAIEEKVWTKTLAQFQRLKLGEGIQILNKPSRFFEAYISDF